MRAEEWEAIPDIGDYTIKRQKRETYAPAPDSLLAAAASAGASGNTVLDVNGLATPAGGSASSVSNLTDIGEGLFGGDAGALSSGRGSARCQHQSRCLLKANAYRTPNPTPPPPPQPGEGRSTVLGLKLDSMADSVSGQTVIDPKGYLTDLSRWVFWRACSVLPGSVVGPAAASRHCWTAR